MRRWIPLIASLTITVAATAAVPLTPSVGQGTALLAANPSDGRRVEVNNRPLANINGSPITVVDVQKQLDLMFYQQFPHYSDVAEARYQFYAANWQYVLQDLIDRELIVADAAKMGMEISQGDVRQEMERLFGPTILENLERAGLNYDEARELIEADILLRRMMMARVNMVAYSRVTPEDLRRAYRDYAASLPSEDTYAYNLISIRGSDDSKEVAQVTYELLASGGATLENISDILEELQLADDTVTIKVSDRQENLSTKVSPAYLSALQQLTPGEFSTPVKHQSRQKGQSIYRIFYLEQVINAELPSFVAVQDNIRNSLIDRAVGEESQKYLANLREEFHINQEAMEEMIPQDFTPFKLI